MVRSNVPRTRFAGFSRAWEEFPFDDQVEFYSGLTYSPNDIVGSNGTLVLRSSNIQNGEIVFDDNVYVDSKVVNCENVKQGDIVIVVRNGSRTLIGKSGLVKEPMNNTVIGAFMTGIRATQFDFIKSLLDTNNFKKQVDKNLGATINQITNAAFKSMTFMFPDDAEQKAIGAFFKNLDDQITLKQRKLDKLVALKKAMLERMFPKEGEDEPEIRFKGFSGAWEEKKLGDVLDYLQPTPYLVTSTEYDDSYDIPVLTVGKTFILGYSNEKEGVFSKELPVIIFDDFTTDSRYVDFDFKAKSSAMKILVGKHDINVKFTYEAMQKIKYEVGGHGRHWISVFSQMLLFFPCIEEQTQIGNFFQKIDDLISLQKTEITKLKQIKSACLEKMFV